MNFLGAVVLLVAVAATNASIIGHGWGHGWGHGATLVGPSGIVSGAVHPGVVGVGHAGIAVGHAGVWNGHVGLVGSGIEGQWIPDINEKLYDDGSYKPHIYGH